MPATLPWTELGPRSRTDRRRTLVKALEDGLAVRARLIEEREFAIHGGIFGIRVAEGAVGQLYLCPDCESLLFTVAGGEGTPLSVTPGDLDYYCFQLVP
jgi:hypothetical protein